MHVAEIQELACKLRALLEHWQTVSNGAQVELAIASTRQVTYDYYKQAKITRKQPGHKGLTAQGARPAMVGSYVII